MKNLFSPPRPRLATFGLAACLFASSATAAIQMVIAMDGDVPDFMDGEGGTAENPAVYVIGSEGAYHHSSFAEDYVIVGVYESDHNHLRIQSGSTFQSGTVWVGSDSSSNHNKVWVTGIGSSWTAQRLNIGDEGSHNTLTIEGGASVSTVFSYVGNYGTSHHNSVTVTGQGSHFEVLSLDVGMNGTHNSLVVSDGGRVSGYAATVGGDSDDNAATVSGAGSVWTVERLQIGGYGGGTTGNTLAVENGALLQIGEYIEFDQTGDNFLRLAGGYVALAGNQTAFLEDMILEGFIQAWDGTDWLSGDNSLFFYDYFTDAQAALAFSGYTGLEGYTIITGGLSAVPEPSTWALIIGLGALGVVAYRRRAGAQAAG